MARNDGRRRSPGAKPAGGQAPKGRGGRSGSSARAAGRAGAAGRGGAQRGAAQRGAAKSPRPSARQAGRAGVGSRRPAHGSSTERGLGGEQVEGRQAVRELLLAGRRRASEVLFAADLDDADILHDIRDLATELRVPVREISRAKLESTARTEAPQGVVAFAAPLPEADLDELVASTGGGVPFLVALDGVTDPGNLGAVLRSAECAGVTGVVLPRHRSAHVTPTVAKTAAGAIERLPLAMVGGLPSAITAMREAGVWVVGLDAAGERSVWDLAVATEPICLVLGSEGAGLSRLVRQRCDQIVGIPLQGRVGSLNVSVAGALATFEVARRRWIESHTG